MPECRIWASIPVVVAAQIIMGLQTITSRMIDPLQPAVISVTWVEAGAAYNVIPDEAVLRGTVRTLSHTVRATMEGRIRAVADGIASAVGAAIELRYEAGYPPTINTPAEAEIAAGIAAKVVGEANVQRDFAPLMGSEDFAFMLQEKPGAYVFIGNGPGEGGCALHNPHYDFNDQLLPIGRHLLGHLGGDYSRIVTLLAGIVDGGEMRDGSRDQL